MLRLNSQSIDFAQRLQQLLKRTSSTTQDLRAQVAAILNDVQVRGDEALCHYSKMLDAHPVNTPSALEIPQQRLQQALAQLDATIRTALEAAHARIVEFHQLQYQHLAQPWEYNDSLGNRLGQKISALSRVGIYVPGGKAAYPSSVLMNAVPAKIAGVGQIVMTVPAKAGEVSDVVLAAAALAQVDRVFCIGGAQAIGALAYGTTTIPNVDKIVGPGNAYVAEAKRQVFGYCGIDMIAGPSEILIVADGSVDASWAALDLFSQAEHDEMAQAILLCPDSHYLDQVAAAVEVLLPQFPRQRIITQALSARGALIQTRNLDESCSIANTIAAEHVEIHTQDATAIAKKIINAGALFIGQAACEAIGDYCAGSNHVLPTSGTARFSSGLTVLDFIKYTSVLQLSQSGTQYLAQMAQTLANSEQLHAHAASAAKRLMP